MEGDDASELFEVARASEELARLLLELRGQANRLPPVGQAQVIIMDRQQCSAEDAADLLGRVSASLMRPVSDLAAELVAATILGKAAPRWLDGFVEL
jgi:hypothetical protein